MRNFFIPIFSPLSSISDSSVNVVLTFEDLALLDDKRSEFLLDLVLYHSEEWQNVGAPSHDPQQRAYCSKDGKVLIKVPETQGQSHIFHDKVTLTKEKHEAYHRTFSVTKSGVYYFLLINCSENARSKDPPIRLTGFIDFRNPYGHLSAEEYGFLPLYLVAGIIYFIVGLVWLTSMLLNFKNLIRLQIWISLLLGLQLLEAAFYYLRYVIQNDWDTTSPFILACSTLATIYRKSTIRLLVLALSLGYGLVRQHLGTTTYFMILLGIAHLIAGCLHEIAQVTYINLKFTNTTIAAALQFPLVAADAIFYVWTFVAILQLIRQLRQRQQHQKVTLYKRFFFALLIYGVLCTLWFVYTRIHMMQSQPVRDVRWETAFTDRGVWYLMELGIFLCIMVLFRPSVTRLRFSHQEQQRYQAVSTSDQLSNAVDTSLNWVASLVDNNEPLEQADSNEDEEVELHDMNDKSGQMKRVRRKLGDEDEAMQGFVISDDDEDLL